MDETLYKMIKHKLGVCTSWDDFADLQKREEAKRAIDSH